MSHSRVWAHQSNSKCLWNDKIQKLWFLQISPVHILEPSITDLVLCGFHAYIRNFSVGLRECYSKLFPGCVIRNWKHSSIYTGQDEALLCLLSYFFAVSEHSAQYWNFCVQSFQEIPKKIWAYAWSEPYKQSDIFLYAPCTVEDQKFRTTILEIYEAP